MTPVSPINIQIAPGFHHAPGLLSKYFIWSAEGTAGGVYHWESRGQAEAFYEGPWREGILARYGMTLEIEYFTAFALTDNLANEVRVFETPDVGS